MNQHSTRRVLTGIKPTGSPHLGNYVGAIRPAIAASLAAQTQSFYFLADYHALIGGSDPLKVQRATLEIAASWLALGLDPERVTFYRQSDIPEIPELNWLLSCVAAKGMLNRAHAYKASVDANVAAQHDPDLGITAGLYGYPVLMAADILLFGAQFVPVGKDQVQHIEIARDIAARFNHIYGDGRELLTLPEAQVDELSAVLPGLDGRKMSKSYDNTIALFLSPAKMKATVAQVLTNSKLPGEPKLLDDSALYPLYQAFATLEQTRAVEVALHEGLAWGELKAQLCALIESKVAPARARYDALIANPGEVEEILRAGALKARAHTQPFMATLREAVGLRSLKSLAFAPAKPQKAPAPKLSTFKDSEGFRFKLMAADGKTLLLESVAFEDARACGAQMAALKNAQGELRALEFGVEWEFAGLIVANGTQGVAEVTAALTALTAADKS